MPELHEDMYCSQQICIPPSFPYLLRQFAKAAIRSQPGDLLRWSTAYFRCLALNVPPPVKPRLEYPIPKSHFGLTPGWLKALMYQLQNNLTIPFKILWDRWIGACLQHKNLIEVLVLGGFTDPYAIGWFRFIAICASYLTENLTQTMMLICEILTEEPEGGSAMISVDVFIDLYIYLAKIDASEPQWLRNLHFTDSLLSLYKEPISEVSKESTVELEEELEEECIEAEEEMAEEEKRAAGKDWTGVVISCPDLATEDFKTAQDFKLELPGAKEETAEILLPEDPAENKEEDAKEPEEAVEQASPVSKKSGATTATSQVSKPSPARELGEPGGSSIDSILDYMPPRQRDLELLEDLKKLRDAQCTCDEEEGEGGGDYDLDKLKYLIEGPQGSGVIESFVSEEEEQEQEAEEVEELEEEEEKGELIWIDAIPGIGAIVTDEMVEAVEKYMRECAVIQHGMVMPRNVRHYNCPPLEIYNKCACVAKICK